MDIEYLLFLQNLRNGVLSWLSPAALWVSNFTAGFIPLCIICLIYWVWDRKSGKSILFGYGLGVLLNGFLKLLFCVYRPWIRDTRVEPYGDSKSTATGYSFPSAHCTYATTQVGGIGYWLRNKSRIVSIICYVITVFLLFSRNFLGVHAPQDVLVGFLSSVLMMYCAYKIDKWTDEDTKRDKTVMIAGLVLCVVLTLFYQFKSYPLTYLDDGSLLVDPAKMKADSFEGIGFIASFVICRYAERRYFKFDENVSLKKRLIIGLVACIPFAWWKTNAVSIFTALVGRGAAKFICFSVIPLFVMIIVPWIMCTFFADKKEK